jgi:drug/metabolite transporter (DMT)-like permease
MKITLYQALAIAITGQVLYHITQKLVAPGVHPIVSVLTFYATAALLCLPLFFVFPMTGTLPQELAKMNWAIVGVACAIVLIEVGFLLLYRLGGELSTSFVVSSAVTSVAVMIVGVYFFKEQVSLLKVAGIAFCALGIGLITKA